MEFYVILQIDVPQGVRISEYTTTPRRLGMKMTEGDELYDCDDWGGRWKKGKHRKYVGMLSKKQFMKLVDELGLWADDVETMGSLTIEFGWLPAIAFNSEHENAIISAYVTPFPKVKKKELTERDWKRIKKAVVRMFS